jgi:2-polyprenyl-3-methyl-5-hydroxy-6-metoxy-1,4-benzoquinol methylase
MKSAAPWYEKVQAIIAASSSNVEEVSRYFNAYADEVAAQENASSAVVSDWLFVALVNGAHYAVADEFAAAKRLRERLSAAMAAQRDATHSEISALFCLAVLDLQPDHDHLHSYANFLRVKRRLPVEHALHQAALHGEAVAANQIGQPVLIDWSPKPHSAPDHLPCPTCLDQLAKPIVLHVDARFPARIVDSSLLRCTQCGCLYFPTIGELAYETGSESVGAPTLAFYLHLAAGIESIARSIARSARPPGSSFVDIGCGYGFGTDYALRAMKWRGYGVDPCSLAAAGATQLRVPIEARYFIEDDTQKPADVVMVSEVLEHVTDPRGFVSLLRRAIAPGGLLILSTPNAEVIRPETEPSILMPALSIGAHIVLQTAESLRGLLREAGLAHVVVEQGPHSLTAFASDQPFDLENDEATLAAGYQEYLKQRLQITMVGSDLWIGLAARIYQTASLKRDYATSFPCYAELRQALQARFGFDIDNTASLPQIPEHLTPDQVTELIPLCLANLVYVRALQIKASRKPDRDLWRRFAVAARVARQIRPSLRQMNADAFILADIDYSAAEEAVRLASLQREVGAFDLMRFIEINPSLTEEARIELWSEVRQNLTRRHAWIRTIVAYLSYWKTTIAKKRFLLRVLWHSSVAITSKMSRRAKGDLN